MPGRHMPHNAHPLIRWNPRFNTGHAQIDDQHRELVGLLNRFAAEVESDGGAQAGLFEAFKAALRRHFVFEDEALRRLGVTPALLEAHVRHHGESMELLESLGRRMADDPREHSSTVLAEIAHCLLVDLLDEDRYCFMSAATTGSAAAGGPPIAPALQAFGRLFDLLNEQHERLRVSAAVFDHASEAIMITDANGVIEAVNPAFARITGYASEEAVGASSNLLRSGLHEDSFYAGLWQAVSTHGRWQGEIVNRRKNGEVFPVWLSITAIRNPDGRIARMVGVFSDMGSELGSKEHFMHLAHHDALTGLPNRLLFDARAQHSLERCAREGSCLAVLFIDLDEFKPINDRHGHKIGDLVLRDIAVRLRGLLRHEDTVARFGGDEFVALVERVENRAAARGVADKVLAAFPYETTSCNELISTSASIGISIYPEDGRTVEELVDAADQAMYRAKRAKRRQAVPG